MKVIVKVEGVGNYPSYNLEFKSIEEACQSFACDKEELDEMNVKYEEE